MALEDYIREQEKREQERAQKETASAAQNRQASPLSSDARESLNG